MFDDLRRRWPKANYSEDIAATASFVDRIFNCEKWREDHPLNVVLIGTSFQILVWQKLLEIPFAAKSTYGDIAKQIGSPKASQAVGGALGKNPIAFVVPCHRVIGKNDAMTGYHWGLDRKRAMLDWEAGQVMK